MTGAQDTQELSLLRAPRRLGVTDIRITLKLKCVPVLNPWDPIQNIVSVHVTGKQTT